MKFLVFILLSIFTVGCSSLSKEECERGNWKAIGLKDGKNGFGKSRLASHQKACSEHGINVNSIEYKAAYMEGLKSFCTLENGYSEGKAGKKNNRVCPAKLQKEFNKGYYEGKKLYTVNKNIADTEKEIDRLNKAIEQTYEDEQKTGNSLAHKRASLHSQKSTQERKLRRYERELNLLMTTSLLKKFL